ncbi:RICIN domain-containing protein [Mangrovimonas sp. AS39]|uniref:LamG-like jellyroll fold domain-containing protein n=1 Tax=Mangrovimonas futianensis TaxID=2895523 RepID=UPI001E54EDD0|nr:LamG-like jellyroll fold domain-containing protein [Mangrovimonas futianensis]MCF1192324.1 RICIN domain-containing protein [Mangrovimonas futianensis]MCF1195927.1 RICIN domain-containing protein [Mangrovimonas futianensis]
MKKNTLYIAILILGFLEPSLFGQTASTSDNIPAQALAHRNVVFDVEDAGISKSIEFGADLAWANEQNFRRNILFMGLDQIDIVRASFQPTYPLIGGTELTQEQIDDLNWRLYLINTYVGPNTNLALNCDHPWVDDWYVGEPENWEQLIQTTAQAFMDDGHNIVSIGAFNEPDYGWGQGTQEDMYDITNLMNNNIFFEDIRLSGGNTLSCDEALSWYNYLLPAGVNEGNTHQLAGSFDGFADFFTTVSSNGDHATDDELHNIVEALVGYEYGMQTGIWWADIDLASGEMVKAFDGQRIGYAEHRPNWTAAAVYRSPEGKIQAFGGTSERQAVTTKYNFLSKNRVVYYDGIGPYREFVLEMPGGTGYATGQTNAERVINITYGEDVQPYINGQYKLVNRQSGQVLTVAGDYNGANVEQSADINSNMQKWNVNPVIPTVGGDFSYYRIQPVSSANRRLDLNNFSLDNEANIHIWDFGQYGNQQWFLDYVEDGWFYIRSRESSHCIQVNGTGNVEQWEITGNFEQQWRFLPISAEVEFSAPQVPDNLVSTSRKTSIQLDWTANTETDLAGYIIFRAESSGGDFQTIGRNISENSFVDNTVVEGITYYYKIKATDESLNGSDYSNEVSGIASGQNDEVCHLTFDGHTNDISVNLNHAAAMGGSYTEGYFEEGQAISLNGSGNFIHLSPDIVNHDEISLAFWVNWAGFNLNQRLFEFTAGDNEHIYLSPSIGGQMQLTLKHLGSEQILTAAALPANTWSHLVVTLGDEGASIYVDGNEVAQSSTITIRPSDIEPFVNYIGVSPSNNGFFEGLIDDFRVFNYPLSTSQVTNLFNNLSIEDITLNDNSVSIWPNPTKNELYVKLLGETSNGTTKIEMYDLKGGLVVTDNISYNSTRILDVSSLTPGIYILKLQNSTSSHIQKIVIK